MSHPQLTTNYETTPNSQVQCASKLHVEWHFVDLLRRNDATFTYVCAVVCEEQSVDVIVTFPGGLIVPPFVEAGLRVRGFVLLRRGYTTEFIRRAVRGSNRGGGAGIRRNGERTREEREEGGRGREGETVRTMTINSTSGGSQRRRGSRQEGGGSSQEGGGDTHRIETEQGAGAEIHAGGGELSGRSRWRRLSDVALGRGVEWLKKRTMRITRIV